eukprot:13902389-Heterocapsa_arctica.AAC.1
MLQPARAKQPVGTIRRHRVPRPATKALLQATAVTSSSPATMRPQAKGDPTVIVLGVKQFDVFCAV